MIDGSPGDPGQAEQVQVTLPDMKSPFAFSNLVNVKVPEPSAQVKTRPFWPLPSQRPEEHSGGGAVKVPWW